MNIVNKLTLRHLKENKGRTVITTLGICVSVAMITAVFVAVASFMNLFGEISVMTSGNMHAEFYVNQKQLQQLRDDERIDKVGVQAGLENNSYQLENRKSDRAGTGDIYTGDKTNLEQVFTGEFDGTIPENDNEIAVEQSLIEKNELDWKIGDTVLIPVGYRYMFDEETGEEVILGGAYFGSSSERFEITDVQEYKITAILHTNPATIGTGSYIIRGLDSSKLNLTDDQTVSATILMKDFNYKTLSAIKDIIKEYDIKEYNLNKDYLESKLAVDRNSFLITSLAPMAAIVLVIIMIASIVLIYNAFGMSLSERVRYLGMLASVGATKTQKKLSVYYEGLILGAIGIPVGILAGIAGIGITLKAVGGKIISTGMLAGVTDSNMTMKVVVPWWVIIGIVFFSVLTIFISSFIPSKKASHITPIDAIRQSNEIKVKAKKLKSPKIVRAIFGYEGELAHKNLKRNGRKSRVITASIALSVILFLSCNYFCSCFVRSADIEGQLPYQVMVMLRGSERANIDEDIKDIDGIEKAYYANSDYFFGEIDDSLANKEYLTSTYKNLFNSKIHIYLNSIDDEEFNKLCQNSGIDYHKYYGDSVKAVILNNVSHKDGGAKVFNDKVLGQVYKNDFNESGIEISDSIEYSKDNFVCNLNPSNSVSLYVPLSVYKNVMFPDIPDEQWMYNLCIETQQHEKVTESLYSVIDENGYEQVYVNDFVDSMQAMNTVVFILQVFIYGFISLISLITVANIINTISTGMQMRRKEFAMLKSVGTTPGGFRKMISLESIFYGLKALAAALPISFVLSIGINKALGEDKIPFEFDWKIYLIVIVVVFAIVGLTMFYSLHKLKDDNIVETLKEEIN